MSMRFQKKSGFIVVENENEELVQTRLLTKIQACIDYKKLNVATHEDHFPHSLIDQMLEHLVSHEYYYFLDGYSGYNQIPIAPEDQEKTTFICPFRIFTYRWMPFGLCNAPAIFQHYMLSLFFDMVEWFLEDFMDDCFIYEDSFYQCLHHLKLVLKVVLRKIWHLTEKKCHFMVIHEIVLGHQISRKGIEVDRSKINVIAKLPMPKCVKDIKSFLGHAGFYVSLLRTLTRSLNPWLIFELRTCPSLLIKNA